MVGLALPRALLIDLDDTILDWSRRHKALESVCARVAAAAHLDAQVLVQKHRAVAREYVPTVERLCWIGEMSGAQVRAEIWRRALAEVGCRNADRDRTTILASRLQRLAEFRSYRIYPDARELLHSADAHGVPVAVVTNGAPDVQRDKLRALSATAAFDSAVISGEVGAAKPDPRLFLHACETLQVTAAEAWHVGDSLTHDVGGAQSAGIVSVWLNREGRSPAAGRPTPDLTVSDLREITDAWSHASR